MSDEGAWVRDGIRRGDDDIEDATAVAEPGRYNEELESRVRALHILLARLRHERDQESGSHRAPSHAQFPYEDGDTLVLGPEVFISKDRSVLSVSGRNFVPQDEAFSCLEMAEILDEAAGQDGAHGFIPSLATAASWLRTHGSKAGLQFAHSETSASRVSLGAMRTQGWRDAIEHLRAEAGNEYQDGWAAAIAELERIAPPEPDGVVVTDDGKRVGLYHKVEETRRCPTCDSPDPRRHPATSFEGEVQPCGDSWHGPKVPMSAVMRPGGLPPSNAAREQAARAELAELELARARSLDDGLDPLSLLRALREERGHRIMDKAYNAAWVDACDYLERIIQERLANPMMTMASASDGGGGVAESLREAAATADAELGPICGRMMVGEGADSWDPCCELPEGHGGSCWSSSARSQHRLPLKPQARVEDKEGDKATVLRHVDARIVALEWDSRPGHMARVPVMRLTELEDTP